jgi:hypothetical protein
VGYLNVAVTDLAPVMRRLTLGVVPEAEPDQRRKDAVGLAARFTTEPTATFTVQVPVVHVRAPPKSFTPAVVMTTDGAVVVPATMETLSVAAAMKTATTVLSAFMVIVHDEVTPLQAPPQAMNSDVEDGVAVIVTGVLLAKTHEVVQGTGVAPRMTVMVPEPIRPIRRVRWFLSRNPAETVTGPVTVTTQGAIGRRPYRGRTSPSRSSRS